MQPRGNVDDSAFLLFPEEIWQVIFQLSNINLRDIASLLKVCLSFSRFADDLAKVVYARYFPDTYRKLSEEEKKKINLAELQKVYDSHYSQLPAKVRALFTCVKEGDLERATSLQLNAEVLTLPENSGWTVVDLARKKGHQNFLSYFYSMKSLPEINFSVDVLIKNNTPLSQQEKEKFQKEKTMLAVRCLQPPEEIDAQMKLIYRTPETYDFYNFRYNMSFETAYVGHVEWLKSSLIEHRASASWRDEAIRRAIAGEQEAVIDLLSEKWRPSDFSGFSALMQACVVGNANIILRLLKIPGVRISSLHPFFERRIDPDIFVMLAMHPSTQTEQFQQELQMIYYRAQDRFLDLALTLLQTPGIPLQEHWSFKLLTHALAQKPDKLQLIIRLLLQRGVSEQQIAEDIRAVFYHFFIDEYFIVEPIIRLMPFAMKFNIINEEFIALMSIKLAELFTQKNQIEVKILDSLLAFNINYPNIYRTMMIDFLSRGFKSELSHFNEAILSYFIQSGFCDDLIFRGKCLNLAATYGLESIIQSIVAMPGTNVNVLDEEGRTPLMNAARHSQARGLLLLLNMEGIDTQLCDKDGDRVFNMMIKDSDCARLFSLHEYKQYTLKAEPTLLSQFTFFNLNLRLGYPTRKQYCDAIDALSAVIANKKEVSSLEAYQDVFESYIELKKMYEAIIQERKAATPATPGKQYKE